jgi:hypothetical protein
MLLLMALLIGCMNSLGLIMAGPVHPSVVEDSASLRVDSEDMVSQ